MVYFDFWKIVLIFLSSSVFYFVHYEDKNYKPFGLRYWFSLIGCIWLNLVTLISYLVAYVAASIMISNQFEPFLVWIFLFLFLLAIVLTLLSVKAIKILIRRTKYYQRL